MNIKVNELNLNINKKVNPLNYFLEENTNAANNNFNSYLNYIMLIKSKIVEENNTVSVLNSDIDNKLSEITEVTDNFDSYNEA